MSSPVRACALAGDPLLPPAPLGCPCAVLGIGTVGSSPSRLPARFLTPPAAGSFAPVARFDFPSPSRRSVRFAFKDHGSSSDLTRSRLVHPVGPPILPTAIAGRECPRHRSSGSGWRALSGTSRTLQHPSRLVKRYFSKSQGSPQTLWVNHRTFSFIHRSVTGCAQANV